MQNREQVTQAILLAKVQKGITWQQVAEQVGQSKEWTTAGCLGQKPGCRWFPIKGLLPRQCQAIRYCIVCMK